MFDDLVDVAAGARDAGAVGAWAHVENAVVWTSPGGQVHTTQPGSRQYFPALCRPTAAVTAARGEPPR